MSAGTMETAESPRATAQGFRLSPQQRRLWRLQESQPGFAYRNRCAFRLDGELDRETFAEALRRTVARHEILRTSFPLASGMSLPLQVVHAEGGVRMEPGPPPQPLPGEGARVGLARLGEREHELWLDLPALCGDPRSLDLLAFEILRDYAHLRGEGGEPEPPLQLADIAEWQHQLLESTETADAVSAWRDLWREREISAQLGLPLPCEEPADGTAFAPEALAVPLDAGLAVEPGLLLACWQLLLWRGTGRPEVLVGVLDEGRGYDELRSALGPFARHLPVHVRLSPEMRLADLAAANREALAGAGERQEHFDWEHAAGEEERRGGFFPACFEATRDPEPRELAGLRLTCARRADLVDRFKLALAWHRGGGADQLALRYDRRRFRPQAMALLAERMATLLRSAADRPQATLEELPALGARERRHLLVELAPGPGEAPAEGCLHRRFEEQAERSPERPAVVAGGESLSYRELNERANRLAHHLLALGVGLETPVALCLDRSPQAVTAILGVLKAGGAWVPLDPRQPPGRLRLLLEETGAAVLLTEQALAGVAGALTDLPAGVRTVYLDADADAIACRPAANPAETALPGSLAYVIFTSGSTGRPKGVQIEHRSALALLAGLEAAVLARHPRHPAPLRASLNAPLIFDASVQQLVLLTAGHTLHLVPEALRADGEALLGFLRAERLDLFDCTPSQLRSLLAAGLLAPGERAPALFLVAGEAVDEALWTTLGGAGQTVFYNIYGPTECTVDATAERIGARVSPAIGRPLAGYEVYLLDPASDPVPLGAPGEICLGGAGLARGYRGRPDTTAERFVPHPFGARPGARLYRSGDLARYTPAGALEFLGRLDHQVKIRGYRIEPGEIEAALLALPWIAEAAVLARPQGADSARLVACVRLAAGAPPPAAARDEIRRALAARLPGYMLPSSVAILAAFPRLPNGKLDRRALAGLAESEPGGAGAEGPRNPTEEILAGLWSELLHLDSVSRGDDFFERGGHSLLATQLASRVRALFRVELKVRTLFESPTLAELAVAVAAAQRAGEGLAAPPLRPVPREGRLPLSYSQQRLWLHHQLEPASTAYNLPMAVRLRGPLDPGALAAAFEEVVRRHEVLRTTFAAESAEREPAQVIHPPAAFLLPLVDLAALDGAAMAAQALLAADARRPFDLARGPVLRALLVRLGEADHVLAVTLHHIAGDAWSTDLLVGELTTLYADRRQGEPFSLPELPVQYADYAAWQRGWLRGEALDEQLAFWRQRLAGAPPLIRLATDRPRPAVRSARGAQHAVELTAELSGRLRELSRGEGCTLFMTLLASFLVLLHCSSGDEDLVVGSPVSYRNWREVEGMIGFFVNTLPLRGDLAGDPSFRELMARVRLLSLEAFAYEHLPFDRLIGELRLKRSLSHGSLFQVGFTFQAVRGGPVDLPDLELTPFKVGLETAQFDLNLTMIDTPALTGSLQYSRDLFDEGTIAALGEQLRQVLERAAATPDVPLSELRALLAEAERRRRSALASDLEQASAQSFGNRRRQSVAAPRSVG